MQSEQETRELAEELKKLTGFIADFGTDDELHSKDVQYACNITDALYWVLRETQTVRFRSSDYLNLDKLKLMARTIETRTGEKPTNYR
ncbi:unnamed protein product [marine sediment metagenome]|uniref:Uncharacterized protein n=1 Tax=marine sediment metagenome TaxID=412755 RepID=X1R6V6_9ZZZZ